MALIAFVRFVFAIILRTVFFLPMYIISNIIAIGKGEFQVYQNHLALATDCYGNYLCGYVFNFFLITGDSRVRYGQRTETISRVTAANYRNKTLTRLGMGVAHVLMFFKDSAFAKQVASTPANNDVQA